MGINKVTISKAEYKKLKERAVLGDDLMAQLVMGLEDVKHGRIKPWRKSRN